MLPEHQALTELFLTFVAETLDWGREGWRIAAAAKADCERRATELY